MRTVASELPWTRAVHSAPARHLHPPETSDERAQAEEHAEPEKLDAQSRPNATRIHRNLPARATIRIVRQAGRPSGATRRPAAPSASRADPGPPICHQTSRLKRMRAAAKRNHQILREENKRRADAAENTMHFPATPIKQGLETVHDGGEHRVEEYRPSEGDFNTACPRTWTVIASQRKPAMKASASMSGNGSVIAP